MIRQYLMRGLKGGGGGGGVVVATFHIWPGPVTSFIRDGPMYGL